MNLRCLQALRPCLIAALFVLVSACSVLPEPDRIQLIDPRPNPPQPQHEAAGWSLTVPRPETDPARDSARVLVRTENGQLQVHPSARWIAPAPELLQTLAIRWLRDSNRLRRVDSRIAGVDRALRMDLRRFELAEPATGRGLEFVVVVDARLGDASGADLIDKRLFSYRTLLEGDGPTAIVEAVESSLAALFGELSNWLGAHPPD